MKIEFFTSKKNVEYEHSTLCFNRDPLGSFMSRSRNLFLLAIALIMILAIHPAKAQDETIQIDFGQTAAPANWNFFNSNTLNSTKSALLNSEGVATTVGMKLTGIFTNFNNGGTASPASSTGFPGTVTQDNLYAGPTAKPKYDISGLDPTKDYTFIVFCSRFPNDGGNREGKFQFTGSTEGICYLNATGNTSNIATATARPTAAGIIILRISSASGGNIHLNAMKIVYAGSATCTTSFTGGAQTVCQDAASETYTATTTNSTPIVYSVLPGEAGVIDPTTGVMDWNADFSGIATITATADELCDHTTADRMVTVIGPIGETSFTGGALEVGLDAAAETYTATAANSTSVVYSVLPVEAGVIHASTGIMDWHAEFFGTATITATAASLCGTSTVDREVTVNPWPCTTLFTGGALAVCQDAANETYTAMAADSTAAVYSVLPAAAGVIDPVTGIMDWNAEFYGTATITAASDALCGTSSASREVKVNRITRTTTFTGGALTVRQDAASEIYRAAVFYSSSVVYSVLPAEAGVIDPVTGLMDWDADFAGTATITATSEGPCNTTTADRQVTVIPTCLTSFKGGALTVLQDAENETYTATATHSSSVLYSVLPAEAGVIDPVTGIMDWDANFLGTATITATSEGKCGTMTVNRIVTVTVYPSAAQNDTIQIDFGGATGPSNWVKYNPHTAGTNITDMINSNGVPTTVNMKINTGFGGAKTESANPTDPSNGFPITVTNDYFYIGAGGTAIFEISGLDPGKDYTFIIFAARPGADGTIREGKYQFTGSTEGIGYLNATANTSDIATATARPTAEGKIIFKVSQNASGNAHLNAMKIVEMNAVTCTTSFTGGAETVCKDAASETYTATTANSSPVIYSVLPVEAGVIDPATGVMDWDAAFIGTATITATADESCGTNTASRIVTIDPATGPTSFTEGALTVLKDAANETYKATAANGASVVYSVLPAEAGVIDPVNGIMDWDADFLGTATITATSEGLCGTITENRQVRVLVSLSPAQTDTIQVDFGGTTAVPEWNAFSNVDVGTTPTLLNNTNGEATTVGIKVTGKFNAANTAGTTEPDPTIDFPGSVTKTNFYGSRTSFAAMEISGLDPAKEYTFVVFGSIMKTDTDNREGEFQFIGLEQVSCFLNATNNTSNVATAKVTPNAEGTVLLKCITGPNNTNGGGNFHLSDMKIIVDNSTTCVTTFTEGALTLLQDAADETYTVTAANSTSVVYSVLPTEAGVINPVTGLMDWDANFFGTATITATATAPCGTSTADRMVTVTMKPAETQNDTIQIDFGGADGPANWVKYNPHTAGTNITDMINSNGVPTTVSMKINTGFGGAKTESANPTDPSNGFPITVTNDYFYIGAGGTAIFEISGLDPGKDYSFIIFASRPGADGTIREGKYQFTGSTEGIGYLNATANTSNTTTATARPTAEGMIIFSVSQNAAGNAHLNAMKIVSVDPATCSTSFTEGAMTVFRDAADETYTAMAANGASIEYSVLPAEAGVIDPVNGVMDWAANFVGTATITATSTGLCGTSTADREVTVNPITGTEPGSKMNQFIVFPNPAKDFVNIEVPEHSQVRIIDITGKVLVEKSIEAGKNQINLNLQSGLYMIQVVGANKSIYTTKLVVR